MCICVLGGERREVVRGEVGMIRERVGRRGDEVRNKEILNS